MALMRKIRRVTVTDSIIDQLLELLESGRLQPGDRMPTEAELTAQLSVGRTSVREALKALEFLGLIERRNDGTFVSRNASWDVLERVLKVGYISWQIDIAQLFEARRTLEGEIAALAAQRIDAETLAQLEALCQEMETMTDTDFDTYFSLDMRFHYLVCDAASNPVLTRMWRVVHDALESARADIREIGDIKPQTDQNHRLLLEALKRRDAAEARRAVQRALETIEKLIIPELRKGSTVE